MIKQILFDCGGVLVHLNFRQMMAQLSGSDELAQQLISRIWQPDSPWLDYDRGLLSSQQVEQALKAYLPAELHSYMSAFVRDWPLALPPMEGMEQLIDALHQKGYPCYLLSNFAERFTEVRDQVPAIQKLDGMVVSYQIHMLKPDRDIFEHTFQTFDILPEETLFVDDSPGNIAAAQQLGMETHLFRSPEILLQDLQQRHIL